MADAASDDERLADLVRRLDEDVDLLVVDDLHALEPGACLALVRALAGGLRLARVVATSRERVAADAPGPDRFELHLGDLDAGAARALWGSLDELHGPVAGFDEAWARSRGNPLLLRRAHAGGVTDDDPIAAVLRGLTADELELARALALCDVQPPAETLAALLPGTRGRDALRRLVAALLVNVNGAGRCAMHDVVRAALLADAGAATRVALHERLAALLAGAPLDAVTRGREVCRQLCAAGRWAEADATLLAQAGTLIRHGATGDVLAAIAAIPAEQRSPALRIVRARCFARLLELERAHAELAGLVRDGVGPRHELRLALAQSAQVTARLELAAETLLALIDDRDASPSVRGRALSELAVVRAHQGRGDDGRALLARAVAATREPLAAGQLLQTAAFSLIIEERYAEAEGYTSRARALLDDFPAAHRAVRRAPLLTGWMLASLSRIDEAEAVLASRDAPRLRGDRLSALSDDFARATLLREKGERLAALELFRECSDGFARGGHLLGALWMRPSLIRMLLLVGRRREALELLERTRAQARDLGLAAAERRCARSLAADPLRQLARGAGRGLAPGERGHEPRERALAALRHAAAGRQREALALVEQDAVAGPGFGLDRALAHLARAVLARLDGDEAAGAAQLARAVAEAAADGADPELVVALDEAVGRLRIVSTSERRLQPRAPADLSRFDVILDERTHELSYPGGRLSLRRRPVLRRLLYALASRYGRALSKEILAERALGVHYHPLRHDNLLAVHMRRLRAALAPAGLKIDFIDDGYGLSGRERFAYVGSTARA